MEEGKPNKNVRSATFITVLVLSQVHNIFLLIPLGSHVDPVPLPGLYVSQLLSQHFG